jgi:hypothetical protein
MANSITYTDTVRTNVIVEALKGAEVPSSYLQSFPDRLYNKSADSTLYKFLFTLTGPSGVGVLKKQLFEMRLILEANGMKSKQLEMFYGDVFKFFKVTEENYDFSTNETLTQSDWVKINLRDASYRNRAIDYLHAARLGTTPDGMALAARSGLGKDVQVIENYKYLFDIHSDDPIGLENYGQTGTTSEFIIFPSHEVDQSYAYSFVFNKIPNSGSYSFTANGTTSTSYTGLDVINFKKALSEVSIDATVYGSFDQGFTVVTQSEETFTFNSLLYSSGAPVTATISTVIGSQDNQLIQKLTPRNQYDAELALDYLKPANSVVSYKENQSSLKRQSWSDVNTTSSHAKVVRFVTGSSNVSWPAVQGPYWIESNKEKESPRVFGDNRQHYQGFHTLTDGSITAYSDDSSNSSKYVGDVNSAIPKFPYQINQSNVLTDAAVYKSDNARAFSAETQMSRTSYLTSSGQSIGLINGIYPVDYLNLQGTPNQQSGQRMWLSSAREAVIANKRTSEILNIDLGSVKAVNFIGFETLALPFDIAISYDILNATGSSPLTNFVQITSEEQYPFETSIFYDAQAQNPWEYLTYNFTDSIKNIIFTRFIKIKFTRKDESNSDNPLFYDRVSLTPGHVAWPIAIRNLRLGRNV